MHAGIRCCERSKSQLVRVTREIGKAYRHLGRVLVAQQLLPDEDLIYFFTHEELCACLGVPSSAQVRHAQRRRQAMAYQNRLQMPFLVQGKPGPLQRVQASSGNVFYWAGLSVRARWKVFAEWRIRQQRRQPFSRVKS